MASARVLNDLFAQRLDTSEGKEKIAEYGGVYIRDRLREVAFSRKIIPPQMVTRADCQRSVNHDTLVKIVDIEPQSRAMAISFRGSPTARYIDAPRYEIPFFTVSSEKFEKTEQELLAYEMPITKVIEDNSVKDIQEIEDREFLRHVEAALQELQFEANASVVTGLSAFNIDAGAVVEDVIIKGELARALETGAGAPLDNWVVQPVQRPDFVNLFKIMSGGQLPGANGRMRLECVLLAEPDFDDILQWTIEDFGDKITSETVIDGYKYNLLLGRRFIRTVKVDILRTGNVYGFAAPNFLGKFYILNNTKFYIDKVANLITWQSWEDIGMGFGNIRGLAKLELYSASVATRGGVAAFGAGAAYNDNAIGGFQSAVKRISDEEDLGAVNNRAEDSLTFPQVDQF
jgi:hypothetical protein